MGHARGRFGKKIDTVHWALGSWQARDQAAGTVALNVLGAQHLPETLLRIRGEYAANLTGAIADGVGVNVTQGLIQVPEGTDTTVLWSPITDGDAPWIWWDTMNLLYDELVADVVATQSSLSGRRVVDSKAMRKIRNTEIQWVAEIATITGFSVGSINVAGQARFLAGS